jgi:hypothetical protein
MQSDLLDCSIGQGGAFDIEVAGGAGRRIRFSGIVGRGCGATLELGRSSCWQLRGRAALPARDRAARRALSSYRVIRGPDLGA